MYDNERNKTGLKKDSNGAVVMSKLDPEILAKAAR